MKAGAFGAAGGSGVKSVERAIEVLEVLSDAGAEMSLSRIAEALGWPKSTVHGLLATLRAHHYVEQSAETGHYWLGSRLFELGNQVARSWKILKAARPVMLRLLKELDQTVQLGMEENGEVLYLEKLVPNTVINIISDVGTRLPMHCSALGKVLLAQKKDAQLRRHVADVGLPAMTRHTITSLAALESELDDVRRRGYAIDDEETMEGLRCAAVPVRASKEGPARHALSVSGARQALQGAFLDKVIVELKLAAEEIFHSILASGHKDKAE